MYTSNSACKYMIYDAESLPSMWTLVVLPTIRSEINKQRNGYNQDMRIIGKFSLAGICDSDFDATTKFVILNILSIVLVCNVRNGSGEEIPFSMDK